MSFISPSAHKKFVEQCQVLINKISIADPADQKTVQLKADLEALQHLLDNYLATMASIPELTRSYNDLHRRIRINARKLQTPKNSFSARRQ